MPSITKAELSNICKKVATLTPDEIRGLLLKDYIRKVASKPIKLKKRMLAALLTGISGSYGANTLTKNKFNIDDTVKNIKTDFSEGFKDFESTLNKGTNKYINNTAFNKPLFKG